MSCFAKRHRSANAPLFWTILLAGCVALASSLHIVPPLLARGLQHLNLRRRDDSPTTVTTAAAARRLSVFGDDDRRPVGDPSQYPYSAVGLLRWTDTLSCTASLIGDRFIVTAAECVLDADGNVRKSSFAKPQFLPGYAFKSSTGAATPDASADKAYVTKVHKQSDYWKKWTQNTYVILELDAAVDQRYGVLQLPMLADLDQSTGKTEVQLAGYDDKALDLSKAAMQYTKCTCYFPSGFNGPQYLLLHDCDTSAVGSPGSPLLVRYTSMKTYIIGIHSNAIGSTTAAAADTTTKASEFKLETANRGVLGPFIQKHLEALVIASASTGTTPPTAPSTTANTITSSGSGSGHETSKSPATTTAPPRTANSRGRMDDSALLPGTSRTNASSSRSARITPAAAYICIAFVACAWASILFIAVRHVRRGTDLTTAVMDDDPIDETDALE